MTLYANLLQAPSGNVLAATATTTAWAFLVFAAWCAFFVVLILLIIDLIRRRDISRTRKALWVACWVLLPILSTAAYVAVNARRFVKRRALWITCWILFFPLFALVYVLMNLGRRFGVGPGFPPRTADPEMESPVETAAQPAVE
jgi:hypothetical protein